ncbi:MAG: hypothetical protein MJ191_02380 [Clostridium sp.]|nr:hypothetical protein [Clostridium sp.]
MKKPSIFSKDYEKIMRKRKRKKIFIGILSICIAGILLTEVANYDFSKLKDRLQAWVDEGKENNATDELVEIDEVKENTEVQEPVLEEVPEEKYLDVTISDTPISFKLKEENSETLIESVKELPENYYIYIYNNGKDAVVLDPNQNINIVYPSGEIKDVTLAQYVGPDGDVYIKDNIINIYQGYIWHNTPIQIGEKKIAYITNIPYFGYNLSKYISILDIDSNIHSTVWASKATEITFGEIQEKGLEVNIDGNVRYINLNGELVY